MNARFRNRRKALVWLVMGTLMAGSSNCLPDDFLYTYSSQAGISLLNALTSNLAFSIADALVPPPDTTAN